CSHRRRSRGAARGDRRLHRRQHAHGRAPPRTNPARLQLRARRGRRALERPARPRPLRERPRALALQPALLRLSQRDARRQDEPRHLLVHHVGQRRRAGHRRARDARLLPVAPPELRAQGRPPRRPRAVHPLGQRLIRAMSFGSKGCARARGLDRRCWAALFAGALSLCASCSSTPPRAQDPAPSKASAAAPTPGSAAGALDDQASAAAEIKARVLKSGRAGLAALSQDPDAMIALAASWERAKGHAKETDEFLALFEQRLGVKPPEWWQTLAKKVVVYKTSHYFPGVVTTRRSNLRMVLDLDDLVVHPEIAGFRYPFERRHHESGELVWTSDVWAAGRTALLGTDTGAHQIEFVTAGDRVFVFGAESHGLYAEAFALADGHPLFRFCSCHWFDFSETWGLK